MVFFSFLCFSLKKEKKKKWHGFKVSEKIKMTTQSLPSSGSWSFGSQETDQEAKGESKKEGIMMEEEILCVIDQWLWSHRDEVQQGQQAGTGCSPRVMHTISFSVDRNNWQRQTL